MSFADFLACLPFLRFSSLCFKDLFRYEKIHVVCWKWELFSDLKLSNFDEIKIKTSYSAPSCRPRCRNLEGGGAIFKKIKRDTCTKYIVYVL